MVFDLLLVNNLFIILIMIRVDINYRINIRVQLTTKQIIFIKLIEIENFNLYTFRLFCT